MNHRPLWRAIDINPHLASHVIMAKLQRGSATQRMTNHANASKIEPVAEPAVALGELLQFIYSKTRIGTPGVHKLRPKLLLLWSAHKLCIILPRSVHNLPVVQHY